MSQAIVIAIVVSIALADELSVFPIRAAGGGWPSIALFLAPFVVICAVSYAWIRLRFKRATQVTLSHSVRRVDRAILITRIAILLTHGVVLFGFGMLDAAREITGDLVLIDEALAALPALLALVWTWVSMYPVERALALVAGEEHAPTLGDVVVDHVRHDVLLYLIPIAALVGWSEWIDNAAWETRWAMPDWGRETVRWCGVIGLLFAAPLVLRVVWDTTAFPGGELHSRLRDLARSHNVRYHALRVWHPRAPIANGAVIGPVRFTRIILLTDALIDRLPVEQVEAVMAHEVAHARRRHLPWMMVGLLAVLTLAWGGSWWLTEWIAGSVLGIELDAWTGELLMACALVPAGVVSLLAFGSVSRRFEYQADAFAASHLSGEGRTTSEHGADTMAHALLGVAHINHLPIDKRTFRHGSIAGRVERLYRLPGAPRWGAPIDRQVIWIKVGIAVLAVGMIAWMLVGS